MSRTANLLGALSLVAGDRVRDATGAEPTWSAALVTLQTMTDGGSIDELRRVLGLSHSGGVRVVKALSRAGLVELRRDPDDGRAVQVRLTGDGRAAARASAPPGSRRSTRCWTSWIPPRATSSTRCWPARWAPRPAAATTPGTSAGSAIRASAGTRSGAR